MKLASVALFCRVGPELFTGRTNKCRILQSRPFGAISGSRDFLAAKYKDLVRDPGPLFAP